MFAFCCGFVGPRVDISDGESTEKSGINMLKIVSCLSKCLFGWLVSALAIRFD